MTRVNLQIVEHAVASHLVMQQTVSWFIVFFYFGIQDVLLHGFGAIDWSVDSGFVSMRRCHSCVLSSDLLQHCNNVGLVGLPLCRHIRCFMWQQ